MELQTLPLRDPEFERLASCRKQTVSDAQLSAALKKSPPPIPIWQGLVLLSYRELRLCRLYSIPYVQESHSFAYRQEAVIFICETILREGTDRALHRKYLLGKLYLALMYLRQKTRGSELSRRLFLPGQPTFEMLKERYGAGHYAVVNAKDFAEGLDAVADRSPVLAARILAGDIYFTVPDLRAFSKIDEKVFSAYAASPRNRECRKRMREEVKQMREHPDELPVQPRPQVRHQPQIKQTPAYDPDAELRSITLTIPAWTGSLKRAAEKTVFSRTTALARMQFRQALYALREAISETEYLMEENRYEYR